MTGEDCLWKFFHMESRDPSASAVCPDFGPVVRIGETTGEPKVVVVCEHASRRIPVWLGDMGLNSEALSSHIAWDPGALPVAQSLARQLDGVLVQGEISRLVYDCNRPPEARDAIPAQSEDTVIPANVDLVPKARQDRVDGVYAPFAQALNDTISQHIHSLELMVTVHSFTPVYRGTPRDVELGLLHGKDARFAKKMITSADPDLPLITRLNEPYSAADGVAHTLDCHAMPNGLLNVMIEVRNDLIQTHEQQQVMADCLAPWINRTLSIMHSRDVA